MTTEVGSEEVGLFGITELEGLCRWRAEKYLRIMISWKDPEIRRAAVTHPVHEFVPDIIMRFQGVVECATLREDRPQCEDDRFRRIGVQGPRKVLQGVLAVSTPSLMYNLPPQRLRQASRYSSNLARTTECTDVPGHFLPRSSRERRHRRGRRWLPVRPYRHPHCSLA